MLNTLTLTVSNHQFWIYAIICVAILIFGIMTLPQPLGAGMIGLAISMALTWFFHVPTTMALWIDAIVAIVATVVMYRIEDVLHLQARVAPGETLIGANGVVNGNHVIINGREFNYQDELPNGTKVTVTKLIDATTVAVKETKK